jgi:apolipoprotein N-acyltransferase
VISQHANPLALRLSSLTGFWGVTFVIWYISACIAAATTHPKQVIKPAIAMLGALVLLAAYTYLILPRSSGTMLTIAAIEGPDTSTLRAETAKLHGKARIVVWPEIGLEPDDDDVLSSARESHVHIAANFAEPQPSGKPLNISYYISPNAVVLGKFRKQHLFGAELFRYGRPMHASHPITDDANLRVAVPTCYDTMFTDVIRNYVREGADLILVPNCDPEAPNYIFGRMHAAMTAFRAAENAVPIAMADPMSISTIFDSTGKVLAQTKPGEFTAITGELSPRRGRTLYNRTGDILPFLCIIYMLLLSIPGRRKRNGKRRVSFGIS